MGATGVQPLAVKNIVSIPGNGMKATWNGMAIRTGWALKIRQLSNKFFRKA
jgi:hypothetical protein